MRQNPNRQDKPDSATVDELLQAFFAQAKAQFGSACLPPPRETLTARRRFIPKSSHS